jgi:hypothetical protein
MYNIYKMGEREKEFPFSAIRVDIFLNISYKGANKVFFIFYFFCQIRQSTKFQDITIF